MIRIRRADNPCFKSLTFEVLYFGDPQHGRLSSTLPPLSRWIHGNDLVEVAIGNWRWRRVRVLPPGRTEPIHDDAATHHHAPTFVWVDSGIVHVSVKVADYEVGRNVGSLSQTVSNSVDRLKC